MANMRKHLDEIQKNSKFITAIFLLSIISVSAPAAIATLQTSASITGTGKITHYPGVDVTINPTQIIGTNNLSLGFMVDFEWKKWLDSSVMRDLTQDGGFRLIRVFDFRSNTPRLTPCTYFNEANHGSSSWDWTYVDQFVERVFEVGAEPLFALGWARENTQNYIPSGMAINPSTGLPYPSSWAAYCSEWVRHFKSAGYPVQYYEVTNEPWLYFGWNDQPELSYFVDMFNTASIAMRQQNPNVKVGFDGTNRKPVLDYCIANNIELGFISFHKYDSGEIGYYTPSQMFSRAETFMMETSTSYYGIQEARQIYYNAHGVTLPVIISEYNYNANPDGTDPLLQTMTGATWDALVLRKAIEEGANYGVYYSFASSKSWELANKPTGGWGFGMINSYDNQPWYPYYVSQMIGTNIAVGDQIVSSSANVSGVKHLCWIHNGSPLLLVINIEDTTKTFAVQGISGVLDVTFIDDSSSTLQTTSVLEGEPIALDGYTVMIIK